MITQRYKVAGPNEAFIVTGRRGKEVRNAETGAVSTDLSGQKVVMGGGVCGGPVVQGLPGVDLSSRGMMILIRGAGVVPSQIQHDYDRPPENGLLGLHLAHTAQHLNALRRERYSDEFDAVNKVGCDS